jgi:hypothetical protein
LLPFWNTTENVEPLSSTLAAVKMHNALTGVQPHEVQERPRMESAASPAASSQAATLVARARNAAIAFLFALILLIPKILRVRHDPHSWLAFRVLFGFAGAALVILPLAVWNSWLAGIVGLAMFLAAVLAPPALPETNADARSRELGALIVVNGGSYRAASGSDIHVQLFISPTNIAALDTDLRSVLTIPVAQISSVAAEEAGDTWHLQLRGPEILSNFSYSGVFAEHFARVAESSIRSILPATLPIAPRRRAAGAGA